MGKRLHLRGLNFLLHNAVFSRFTKRRTYQRLPWSSSASHGGNKIKNVKLQAGMQHGRKGWRIKPLLKIRIRSFSPVNLLRKLRDAYVDMMLAAAAKGNLSAVVMGYHGVVGKVHLGRELAYTDFDKQYTQYLKTAMQQGRLKVA